MNAAILTDVRRRFWAWIDARQGSSQRHQLNRRNLYVFPSFQGLWFLVLVCVLWLVGTNYQNNLVLALAFLLTTLFVVSILHTFANLSGLSIQLVSAQPVFVGEMAEIKLLLSKVGKRARDNVQLYWQEGPPAVMSLIDRDEITVSVYTPVNRRGWYDPGRLIVETYYPLGIIRSWTRLNMDCRVLAYPQPIKAGPLPAAVALNDEGDESSQRGSDEFAGHRHYQPGDSLRNVAWKHYARGMGVYSKEFTAYVDHRLWLDWDYLPAMPREARLSRLCYWVLEAHKTGQDYGLRLPGTEVPPGRGEAHLRVALRTLALFEAGR